MKLICESLQDFLNENYENYEELRKLTSEIVSSFNEKELKKETYYILDDIVDMSQYTTIGILKNLAIEVMAKNTENSGFYNLNTIKKHKKFFKDLDKRANGVVSINFLDKRGQVIHELQHALDWHKRKGLDTLSYKSDEEYDDGFFQKYYADQTEQSAFFTEAINALKFFDENGNIRDIHDMFNEFKETYGSLLMPYKFRVKQNIWNKYLTPEIKKRLARRFSQYYHKIKEHKQRS